MAFGDSPVDEPLRDAWHAFCDRLKQAGDKAFKDANPAHPLLRADAFRFQKREFGRLGRRRKKQSVPNLAHRTRHDIAQSETAAGRFKNCVRVVEEGAASVAVVQTTYCPDVGPVQVESRIVLDHGTVQVIARLRGYRIGAEPSGSGAVKSK